MTMLELRHLQCLDAVARERSFGRAAKSLGVGQPFVSLSIQRIERAVGEILIERRPQVRLTPAGRAMVDHARAALNALGDAVVAVRAISDGGAGELRLGFPNWLAPTPIPEWIAAFSKQRPKIVLSYATTSTREQLDWIKDGRLDLGFIREPALDDADLEMIRLTDEPFMLALPAAHRAAEDAAVRLSELGEEPFLLFPREFAPAFHDLITGLLKVAGIGSSPITAAADWFAILAQVRAGGGLALVPRSLAEFRLPGLVFLPLADLEAFTTVAAVTRAGQKVGALATLVASLQSHADLQPAEPVPTLGERRLPAD